MTEIGAERGLIHNNLQTCVQHFLEREWVPTYKHWGDKSEYGITLQFKGPKGISK